MGNKVILIALITLIATAGYLLIKSETPITIAGETLGAQPVQVINHQTSKESPKPTSSSNSTSDSKK